MFGFAAGSGSDRLLAEAAEIASWLGLELLAMTVEDEAVATLGAHPGAAWLSRSGAPQPPGISEAMARETRTATSALRRRLEHEAARVKLTWSFQTLRGSAETVIAQTVRQSDIVVYCEPPSPLERDAFPERNLWRAVERSPGAALYRPGRPLPNRSGVVAVTASGASRAPVEAVAQQLARATHEPLHHLAGIADWRALPQQWDHNPPRLIVLARGTMGLLDSDAIAQAARHLRVPLLVLEEAPQAV
ncbi:hypothetical protein D1F64_03110 [Breoghania sp. L-A4]|nr:hypothetical protein D1F64_03110 [Breoghania sp. L-A4]